MKKVGPMPRKSPYHLKLTKEQRHELESRSRKYTLAYRDVTRARIVIAARLDTRREIVSKWRKRFFERGLAGLEEEDRGGRPAVSLG